MKNWRWRRTGLGAVLILFAGLLVGGPPTAAYADGPCAGKGGSLSFSPATVRQGETTTVSWQTDGGDAACQVSSIMFLGAGLDPIPVSERGSMVIAPGDTHDWELRVNFTYANSDGLSLDEPETVARATMTVLPAGTVSTASTVITGNDAASRGLLVRALNTPNQLVSIAGGVNLDMDRLEFVRIAPGVRLIGDQSTNPQGPRLFTKSAPRVLFVVDGPSDNVRISGIRFDGGEPDDPCASAGIPTDVDAISIFASQHVEIDHNEFTKWRGSAVHVHDDDGSDRLNQSNKGSVRVHDNYFHDNQHPTTCTEISTKGHGNGYGVEVSDGAYALIDRNVFQNNRHAIASNGANGSGYYVYDNLFLHPGIDSQHWPVTNYNHQIDVHGQTKDCPGYESYTCGTAGEYMDVAHNTVASGDSAAIQLRGEPTDPRGMSVHDNVFYQGHDDALTQTQKGLHDDGGNLFLTSLFPEWANQRKTCDFDGDGTGDTFWATGTDWWYASSRLGGRWTFLARSGAHPSDVSVRDVNGDGYCDAVGPGKDVHLGPTGTGWKINNSYGSPIAMAAYPGPGGGMAIVGTNGADGVYLKSQTSAGLLTGWGQFDGAMRSVAADTNADGRIEVFAVDGAGHLFNKWQGTPGGNWSAGWHPWDGELNSIAMAHNRNGQLEVFGTNNAGAIVHRWNTTAGWGGWSVIGGQLHAIAAETNADGLIELVGVNFQGQIFHKVQTVANSNVWTEWQQLPGQLSSIAIARNQDGRLEIFGANALGEDFHSVETAKNSDNWQPLETLEGSFSQIAAEANADGRMELFGVDPQGNPVYRLQVTAGSWAGSNWTPVEGMLRPTAVVLPDAPAQITSNAAESQVGRVVAGVRPVVVSSGTQPYAFRADGLPPGLTMSPLSGAVSGIPTAKGVYSVHTTVTDSSNPSSTLAATFTWTVDAADCWNLARDHIVRPIPDLSSVDVDNFNGCSGNASASSSVSVDITHPYIGDLVIDLIAPSGHVYNLRNRVGGSADNLVTTYSLNLSGEPKEGLWRLRITDAVSIDVGQLNSMSLSL